MRGFIKTLTVFIYFFLALLIQPSSVLAFENLTTGTFQQYISSQKPETSLINNKKEEYYAISRNDSELEIVNPSNKDNFGFSGFNEAIVNYNNAVEHTVNSAAYPIYVSYNASSYLKNAIYTRAP